MAVKGLTPSYLWRGTSGDREPRRWGKAGGEGRERGATIPKPILVTTTVIQH